MCPPEKMAITLCLALSNVRHHTFDVLKCSMDFFGTQNS